MLPRPLLTTLTATLLLAPFAASAQTNRGPFPPRRKIEKTADLKRPITVEFLRIDYPRGQLSKTGAARLRLTNRNPYPIIFRYYSYHGEPLVADYHKGKFPGKSNWYTQTAGAAGAGPKQQTLGAGEGMEVLARIMEREGPQQVYVKFSKADDSKVFTEQLLFERAAP